MDLVQNRYDFMFYVACENGNPNGDPDMNNMPRTFGENGLGYMTDVSIKSRIRQFVAMAYGDRDGYDLFVKDSTNLNAAIARAKENAGVPVKSDKTAANVHEARRKACEMFWDVRTFGAVMSTGPNAGQVKGPVQFTFGRSLDVVHPYDIGITRCAVADGKDSFNSAKEYEDFTDKLDQDKLRTMGRKTFIPFGLYEFRGFVSANLAAQTGFSTEDLDVLFQAVTQMFDHSRTSSKGEMYLASPLILFRHDGDPQYPEDAQKKQALLGRAPSHTLFDLVYCHKKCGVENPLSAADYECTIDLKNLPDGISVGFMEPYHDIVWDHVPERSWITEAMG